MKRSEHCTSGAWNIVLQARSESVTSTARIRTDQRGWIQTDSRGMLQHYAIVYQSKIRIALANTFGTSNKYGMM
jgi:hypothetical protein